MGNNDEQYEKRCTKLGALVDDFERSVNNTNTTREKSSAPDKTLNALCEFLRDWSDFLFSSGPKNYRQGPGSDMDRTPYPPETTIVRYWADACACVMSYSTTGTNGIKDDSMEQCMQKLKKLLEISQQIPKGLENINDPLQRWYNLVKTMYPNLIPK